MNGELIKIINQVFEMEKKVAAKPEMSGLQRNIDRIKTVFEEMGFTYHNPAGEKYSETRTDCDASITGELKDNMVIADVVKPVIFETGDAGKLIIQKAVVLVQNK
jgi:hypothetical protein